MTEDNYVDQMLKGQIARDVAAEALTPVDIPRFITTDDTMTNVFYELERDGEGKVLKNEDGSIRLYLPLNRKIMQKIMVMLNSHLMGLGNMTVNEADIARRKIRIIGLEMEEELPEDEFDTEDYLISSAMAMVLEQRVRDNIHGWKGKLSMSKEIYAHITSASEKARGVLGGLLGRK